MSVNRKISWVHLTSRVKQLIVAVLSVTFGISMYIFLNSFMSGVNDAQSDITFTSMAHIKIYNDLSSDVPVFIENPKDENTVVMVSNNRNIKYTEGIKNAAPIINAVSKSDEVVGIAQQVNQNVIIRNGVTKYSALLSGIEVTNENQLFKTSQYMIYGSLFDLEKRSDGIVLGSKLAKNLGVSLGDNVSILTSDNVTKIYKIIGIFETGSAGTDGSKAMVSIQTARQLLSKNKSFATDIMVNIKDYSKAKEVAAEMKDITSYKTEPWQEGNSQLDSANVIRDILAMAVSLTILIVAGFGIYNIMNMTVNEKIREIAILKAMGFNGKDIVEIFLTQSIIIGLVGGLTGVVLGNIISRIVDNIPFKIASYDTLPINFRPSDYILAFIFGLFITVIAGYLPARKASKVDPVSILRG
ncbi:ABC transporter permease [Chryseobacterium sp. SC28]|uniref:ABC transporter permease n=1 Tax=Chryseobacterium sp. SC28 TaxID=2268028 RepID=UPI000F654866|nr:FtsX-like permease family protein [Chryseobacterium sp. SC28]RRQ46850.1 ABC transporter permease [Chryseobacterium sp. SC28]